MTKKYFGTDGIRGRVGTIPMTTDWVLHLGKAIGAMVRIEGGNRALIGVDTRESCGMLQAALSSGLMNQGIDVQYVGVVTTPVLAFLCKVTAADCAFMLSASHNPYYDNGIKCFTKGGVKFSTAQEQLVENKLKTKLQSRPLKLGSSYYMEDVLNRYIAFCQRLVPTKFNLKKYKIILDCANGAGFQLAPQVFSSFGAKLICINNEPDGRNINKNCGATSLSSLKEKVIKEQADLGIALDGDGDRLQLIAEDGYILDGDDILYILALWYKKHKKLKETVVATVMSNLGLEQALAKEGIKLHRTAVGDKYVCEKLQKDNLLLGGETSGHILCLDKYLTGDGIACSLLVLNALEELSLSIEDIKNKLQKHPQIMKNIKVENAVELAKSKEVLMAVKQAEIELADKGRIVLRPSGTEPVLRIMVEGEKLSQVKAIASRLESLFKTTVS